MKKRILVCGGREFKDLDMLTAVMNWLCLHFDPKFCLIHGFARGADMTAHAWAFFKGCPLIAMPANWDFYGDKAGPIRNQWMLDYAMPDLIVAFPGGKGTADMVRRARAAGIDVYEVPAHGA